MKLYPVTILETDFGVFRTPTVEAVNNFESYLEPEELEFFKSLPEGQLLSITISVNPFNAFASIYENRAKT